MITEAKLNQLKREIEKCIRKNEDSVCIYKIESLKYTSREEIGVTSKSDNIL
jgi:CRISPR-associated protein Cas2